MKTTAGKERQGLSRREFLRNTAGGAGALAAAGTGLMARPAAAPRQAAAPPAAAQQFPFETPPPPVPADKISSVVRTDVVVVGAGTAGLLAALAAAKAKAGVVVVEKMDQLQGRGGDNTALNSKLHKKLGMTIDEDRVVDALMRRGEGRLNQDVVNLWARNSGRVMDTIIDLCAAEGLPTYLVIPDRGDDECAIIDKWPNPTGFPKDWDYLAERNVEFPTCHRPGGRAESQRIWLKAVEKAAQARGAAFHYGTKALQLVRPKADGRVTGVVAQKKDGSHVRFEARKGVVLCTGDYGFNRQMMAKYCPQMPLPCMLSTSMGEGHQMAMWIGAVMENPPHAPMSHMFHVMGTDAFLMVNRFGRRFYNEDSDTESMANQTYEQGGAWVVFDDSWEEDVPRMGPGFKRVFRVTDKARQEFRELVSRKPGGQWGRSIVKADTLDGLAAQMKVPAKALKATIERYNALARSGKDLDYGKRADRLTAVDKPPFYAEWTAKPAMSLVVLGGLLTDERLRALDKDGRVIPGLYLAGNTVGRRFKSGYPLICPGLSHSMAYTHGYLAGEFVTSE
ncbi:MAG TPA: FAD-dependent oxidoreductase [Candidatus Aminicenantes bacterium]|nr:FAD-dependent oxidoreductase [Candidatus Aminicenantes bacterium]